MKNETLSSGMAVQHAGTRAVQLRGAECLKNGRAEMFWLRDKLNVISQSPQLGSMNGMTVSSAIRCCGCYISGSNGGVYIIGSSRACRVWAVYTVSDEDDE